MVRYQDLVFRVCFRMLGHRQDAEDAVQETFSRVARHLGRWDPTRPIEPWLVTIAGNRCRTLLSRRRSIRSLAVTAEPASDRAELEQSAGALWEEVQLVLDDLRPELRVAFLLFHQSQLSYAEIGQRLNCPVGTAKTWVHRTRLELIRRLHERDVLSAAARPPMAADGDTAPSIPTAAEADAAGRSAGGPR